MSVSLGYSSDEFELKTIIRGDNFSDRWRQRLGRADDGLSPGAGDVNNTESGVPLHRPGPRKHHIDRTLSICVYEYECKWWTGFLKSFHRFIISVNVCMRAWMLWFPLFFFVTSIFMWLIFNEDSLTLFLSIYHSLYMYVTLFNSQITYMLKHRVV